MGVGEGGDRAPFPLWTSLSAGYAIGRKETEGPRVDFSSKGTALNYAISHNYYIIITSTSVKRIS